MIKLRSEFGENTDAKINAAAYAPRKKYALCQRRYHPTKTNERSNRTTTIGNRISVAEIGCPARSNTDGFKNASEKTRQSNAAKRTFSTIGFCVISFVIGKRLDRFGHFGKRPW